MPSTTLRTRHLILLSGFAGIGLWSLVKPLVITGITWLLSTPVPGVGA